MSDEDLIKAAFKKFDANNDGTISAGEMRAILTRGANPMLSNAEVDEIIQMFDSNGDGKLSIEEFSNACYQMTDEEAESLQARLDEYKQVEDRVKAEDDKTAEEGGPPWLAAALEHLNGACKFLWEKYKDDIKELAVDNLENVVAHVKEGRFTGASAREAAIALFNGAKKASENGKPWLQEQLLNAFNVLKDDVTTPALWDCQLTSDLRIMRFFLRSRTCVIVRCSSSRVDSSPTTSSECSKEK